MLRIKRCEASRFILWLAFTYEFETIVISHIVDCIIRSTAKAPLLQTLQVLTCDVTQFTL
jgi:hypothetical protein